VAELVTAIRRELDGIEDPCSVAAGSPMGLAEMGLVEHVQVDGDGNVTVRFRLTSPSCMNLGFFKVEAEARIAELPGVRSVAVSADLGLDWSPDMMSDAAKARRRAALLAMGIPGDLPSLRSRET
jgi:metal-sulfur cluster biosynthetic enzyme